MRVGVVGAGIAGRSHLFDLAADDSFEVVSVCGARAERVETAAALFSVPHRFTSVDELVAGPRIDAVVVAVPPAVSAQIAGKCVRAGLPTLVDKPAAARVEDLDQLVHAATQSRVPVRVAFNRRYQRHVAAARDIVRRHRAAIRSVACRWSGPFSARYADPITYRHRCTRGDGVILDTGSHIIDTVLYLGLGHLSVRQCHLTATPGGADIEAQVLLSAADSSTPVSITIVNEGIDDDWRMDIALRDGELSLSRASLTGVVAGVHVAVAGGDLCRPVDDLRALRDGCPTRGALLEEAASVLRVIEQARACAARHTWLRPRAKALGRLNGSC